MTENEYGGVMVWALDLDDFNGTFCGRGPFPLTQAMRLKLDNSADTSTESNDVLDPPASTASSSTPSPTFTLPDQSEDEKVVAVESCQSRAVLNDDKSTTLKEFPEWCFEVVAKSTKWFSARDACRQVGGRLVKIVNAGMQDYLSKSLTKLAKAFLKDSYWFGATDLREEGTWKWADGTDMNFTAWATDQPNDHWSAGPKGQDCAVLFKDKLYTDDRWRWNDMACDGEHFFICQYAYEVPCPAPPPPVKASLLGKVLETYSTRSKLQYTCHVGHVIQSGGRMTTCQTNGTWSRDPLHCARIDCGGIKLRSGDVAYVNDTSYQSLAYLTCGHGFVLVGGSLRMCLHNGSWSGETPFCKEVFCGALNLPNGNVTLTSGLRYGSTALFNCQEELLLSGSTFSHCTSSGVWSETAPKCLDPEDIRQEGFYRTKFGSIYEYGRGKEYYTALGYYVGIGAGFGSLLTIAVAATCIGFFFIFVDHRRRAFANERSQAESQNYLNSSRLQIGGTTNSAVSSNGKRNKNAKGKTISSPVGYHPGSSIAEKLMSLEAAKSVSMTTNHAANDSGFYLNEADYFGSVGKRSDLSSSSSSDSSSSCLSKKPPASSSGSVKTLMSDETAVISGRYENVSYSLNGNVSGGQYVIGRSLPEGMSATTNNASSSSSGSSSSKSKGANVGHGGGSPSRVVVGRNRAFEANREILLTDDLMGLTSL